MEFIFKRIARLIDVKSLMTLALTGCFIGLAASGVVDGAQFVTIFTTIVGFYFGTQATKKSDQDQEKSE